MSNFESFNNNYLENKIDQEEEIFLSNDDLENEGFNGNLKSININNQDQLITYSDKNKFVFSFVPEEDDSDEENENNFEYGNYSVKKEKINIGDLDLLTKKNRTFANWKFELEKLDYEFFIKAKHDITNDTIIAAKVKIEDLGEESEYYSDDEKYFENIHDFAVHPKTGQIFIIGDKKINISGEKYSSMSWGVDDWKYDTDTGLFKLDYNQYTSDYLDILRRTTPDSSKIEEKILKSKNDDGLSKTEFSIEKVDENNFQLDGSKFTNNISIRNMITYHIKKDILDCFKKLIDKKIQEIKKENYLFDKYNAALERIYSDIENLISSDYKCGKIEIKKNLPDNADKIEIDNLEINCYAENKKFSNFNPPYLTIKDNGSFSLNIIYKLYNRYRSGNRWHLIEDENRKIEIDIDLPHLQSFYQSGLID